MCVRAFHTCLEQGSVLPGGGWTVVDCGDYALRGITPNSTASVLALAGMNTPEIDLRKWQCKALISSQGWNALHTPSQQNRYLSPAMARNQLSQSIYNQDWIPQELKEGMTVTRTTLDAVTTEDLTWKFVTRVYMEDEALKAWRKTTTGEALKRTGWTANARCEKSWIKHFPRRTITKLSRFLSGHLPTGVYLQRFKRRPEDQSNICRYSNQTPETRDHLLRCSVLNRNAHLIPPGQPLLGKMTLDKLSSLALYLQSFQF